MYQMIQANEPEAWRDGNPSPQLLSNLVKDNDMQDEQFVVTQAQLDAWYEQALEQARQEIGEVASHDDYQDTKVGFIIGG